MLTPSDIQNCVRKLNVEEFKCLSVDKTHLQKPTMKDSIIIYDV